MRLAKTGYHATKILQMIYSFSAVEWMDLALCYSSADSIVNKAMQMSFDGASVDVHYCSTMAPLQISFSLITACNRVMNHIDFSSSCWFP